VKVDEKREEKDLEEEETDPLSSKAGIKERGLKEDMFDSKLYVGLSSKK
jgi:hypothetical protein